MAKTVLFLGLGLGVGLAVAAWFQGADRGSPRPSTPSNAIQQELSSTERLAVETRLELLEGTLAEEIDLRLELDAIVAALQDELDALRGTQAQREQGSERDEGRRSRLSREEIEQRVGERSGFAAGSGATDRRMAQLIEGGFSADQAQRIIERESELRMEALYAQYEATREGERFDRSAFDSREILRTELGDADYERYLMATGQPTSIGVQRVLASSPAEDAGLQPGDQIVAYAGERVFAVTDLNALTLDGEPGQPVAMDVLRDGQQIQIYVPRGPLGITGGGRAFRLVGGDTGGR